MHILIINNGTVRIDDLKKLLNIYTYDIVKLGEINSSQASKYDLIILSGSSTFSILGNEKLYKNEIQLIKNCKTPILGICLGFELIAFSYGAKLELLDKKIKDIIDISVLESGGIFNNLPNFSVYESHRWVVKKAPEEFLVLAESKNGIEVIKHKDKNVYGFQFHPSAFTDLTCGDEIFKNLLNSLGVVLKK